MKLTSKQKLFAAVTAAATLPAFILTGTPAQADPSGLPTYRQLVGVGSDTTEEVLNGLSNVILDTAGTKIIGSYNATGAAFEARDPASLPPGATTCSYGASGNAAGLRANGSSAGRARLVESLTSGNARFGCLDFARSSSLNQAAVTPQLTYIPFALDVLTYAVRGDSAIGRKLSKATLTLIYRCDASTTAGFQPLIPQAGSGTRSSWLTYLGLTEATLGTCVKDKYTDPGDGLLKDVQEHNGFSLIDRKNVVPYSAGQYSAQSIGVTGVADNRGSAVLGGIAGIPGQGANSGADGTRKVYNVIPTARVGNSAFATLNDVFVGPGSKVCQSAATISLYGLSVPTDCGSTALVTG